MPEVFSSKYACIEIRGTYHSPPPRSPAACSCCLYYRQQTKAHRRTCEWSNTTGVINNTTGNRQEKKKKKKRKRKDRLALHQQVMRRTNWHTQQVRRDTAPPSSLRLDRIPGPATARLFHCFLTTAASVTFSVSKPNPTCAISSVSRSSDSQSTTTPSLEAGNLSPLDLPILRSHHIRRVGKIGVDQASLAADGVPPSSSPPGPVR